MQAKCAQNYDIPGVSCSKLSAGCKNRQRKSSPVQAKDGKGTLALVAAPGDILLQLPEELWAVASAVALMLWS